MSFSPEILVKFHSMKVEDALAKVRAYAAVIDANPDEQAAKYKAIREQHDAAEAMKAKVEAQRKLALSLDDVPLDMWDQDNMLRLGAAIKEHKFFTRIEVQAREVEFEDGTSQVVEVPVLRVTAPGMTTTKGAPKDPVVVQGGNAKYAYFHNKERIQGAVSKFIKDTYPESVAAMALIDYSNKDNNAKLGAWEAIKRDPVLKGLFHREKVEPVVA